MLESFMIAYCNLNHKFLKVTMNITDDSSLPTIVVEQSLVKEVEPSPWFSTPDLDFSFQISTTMIANLGHSWHFESANTLIPNLGDAVVNQVIIKKKEFRELDMVEINGANLKGVGWFIQPCVAVNEERMNSYLPPPSRRGGD